MTIPSDSIEMLIGSIEAMHASGDPLMTRILPRDTPIEQWTHYPPKDIVNGPAASRYFYHCHPHEERSAGEHGHFHLFLGKAAMADSVRPLIPAPPSEEKRADVVHLAALSIDHQGLPIRWFTVNRWVTDEWLYPAFAIAEALPRFDLRGAAGDSHVNAMLTAMVRLSQGIITDLLVRRDAQLATADPGGENRAVEVMSDAPVDLAMLIGE